MAISRSKKEAVVEKLRIALKDAKTVVFVRFNGVTSEEVNSLRSVCDREGVGYIVAKKTLMKKAFADASYGGMFPELEGEVALAYGNDILAPARVMGSQAKVLDDRLSILGGVFDNAFIPAEQMRGIAAIPPLETLYAQFLTVIQGPVRGLVSVLGQIADGRK